MMTTDDDIDIDNDDIAVDQAALGMPADLSAELDRVLGQLTDLQLRWVLARARTVTDVAASEQVGAVSRNALWVWRKTGVPIDRAVYLLRLDSISAARAMMRRSVIAAAAELMAELHDPNVAIRHKAAVEILDRIVGRSVQPVALGMIGDVDDLLKRVWGGGDAADRAEVIEGEMRDSAGGGIEPAPPVPPVPPVPDVD